MTTIRPRILVTGAAGHIGRVLCRELSKRGFIVRAVIRSLESASELPPGVELGWCGEIGPATAWPRELFREVDAAVHLAAKVHCRGARPEEFAAMNVQAADTLLRAAGAQVRRFIYCSSVHAVANSSPRPLTEHDECRPTTPYGISKRDGERVVRCRAQATGVEAVVLRPAPVYGAGLPGDLMRLMRYAARGYPLPPGLLRGRRSLVYVENLVDAIIAAVEHPAAGGETFFVSDGSEVTLSELLQASATACGRSLRRLPIPAAMLQPILTLAGRRGAVERMTGSLTVSSDKIRNMLGWRRPYGLAEALVRTFGARADVRKAA